MAWIKFRDRKSKHEIMVNTDNILYVSVTNDIPYIVFGNITISVSGTYQSVCDLLNGKVKQVR